MTRSAAACLASSKHRKGVAGQASAWHGVYTNRMDTWWLTRLSLAITVGVCLYAQACDSSSNSTAEPSKVNTQTSSVIETGVCRGFDHEHPEQLLSCNKITQPLYWLGERFAVPGFPDVELRTSYTKYSEQPITSKTQVFMGYRARSSPERFDLNEWYRPTWNEYAGQYVAYDPQKGPLLSDGRYTDAPVNWWQHPCVEEEVYQAQNGGEVHLYRAHLDSLIRIPSLGPEEVASCLSRPAVIVNARVYFEKTVIEMDFATEPGKQYDSEATVRQVADALRPYDAQ